MIGLIDEWMDKMMNEWIGRQVNLWIIVGMEE